MPARSALVAWDPAKQRAAWAIPTQGAFSGGVLSTAGDLVFQGQADGYITAYSAVEGRRVWAFYSATAALGAPISFAIGKRQYISILNGPTQGAAGSLGAMSARFGWDSRAHPRRLLTFVLDGTAQLPPTPVPTFAVPIDGTGVNVDEALAKEGAACSRNASGATARARSPAAVRPICACPCHRWFRNRSRPWCAAGRKLAECRNSMSSPIGNSRRCAITFERGRGW